ncbi:MAG: stage II sporulation protein R [Faecalibacterium sp.]|nr:stage II sporulation protein R [Ruminococcus sp.]MCM1391961.1 stage II sporulation protein R [Ruminococcus sp.]MCM1485080.1 stage II sporulation protein R [Faecalibacterium sp.]
MKVKLFETAAFFAFIIAVILSMADFEGDCKNIRQEVLRLHVIANSDSFDDQLLKLKVRDCVLEEGKSIFGASQTKQSAESVIISNIELLRNAAQEEINRSGYDYSVSVEVGKSRFPTKTYGDVTLPAGEYDAVRVVIGEGSGKNWWCVMFPPLCLPAAGENVKLDDVMSEDELKLVESDPKYEVRFWLVEKFEQLKEKFK